jgi:hypothetical protein
LDYGNSAERGHISKLTSGERGGSFKMLIGEDGEGKDRVT